MLWTIFVILLILLAVGTGDVLHAWGDSSIFSWSLRSSWC